MTTPMWCATRLHRLIVTGALLLIGLTMTSYWRLTSASTYAQSTYALRLYGSSANDLDRVKIPLGLLDNEGRITTSYPVNIDNDFTIEFWIKAEANNNTAADCTGRGWYYGNIIIDRDVFGNDAADYGLALCAGRLVFGVNAGNNDRLLVGNTIVTNNEWRHLAVTRNAASGSMAIFVDGQLDATLQGPAGSLAYPLNRATDWPNSDPYLVFGAEKHDYPGSLYYNGLLDDIRISNSVRYATDFVRPVEPHPADAETVALYRFDEGDGTTINDTATGNASPGILRPQSGGVAQHWSSDTPFVMIPEPSQTPLPTPTETVVPTNTALPTNTNTALPTNTNTAVPSNTALPTGTNTALPTSTNTALPTGTNTALPTSTSTAVPTATSTAAPTSTGTTTAVPTSTSTAVPTATNTALPTNTSTAVPTATNTALPTSTGTATATSTTTALPTNTPTALPTATSTGTTTAVPTATSTATPTSTTTTTAPTSTTTALPTTTSTALPTGTPTVTSTPVPCPIPQAVASSEPCVTLTPTAHPDVARPYKLFLPVIVYDAP
ncbi:LamG-like jellyroll fold domain-containing protein [Candidatus Chloroploca sp. Khr17]|uniref:LamG-like jellyroll fold domain-containing protein n=1 Tax=Candidatus Chloroploca sp. Khr17 TaxID=2496869 RepID=UPI00196BA2B5|nr:LamG-like jellyroll fold domain-containing protein [Candidatus Chloroploca sp. Khr17]